MSRKPDSAPPEERGADLGGRREETSAGRFEHDELHDGDFSRRRPSPLRLLFTPQVLLVVPLGLSLAAWVTPFRPWARGFGNRQAITWHATGLLTAWYAGVLVAATLGWLIGRRIRPAAALDAVSPRFYYRYLTVIAAVGVLGTYANVAVRHPTLIWTALRSDNFNLVRLAVAYGPGLQTLRYAAILSGAIASYHIFFRRQIRALHAFNLFLLIGAGALASRVSWILAALMAVALYVHAEERLHRPFLALGSLVAVSVLALTAFNYIRNAGYYSEAFDVHNPFEANLYQSATYLAAPFQVAVGVAAHSASWHSTHGSFNYIVNGGAESREDDLAAWSPFATVPSLVRSPRYAHSGRWAYLLRYVNSSPKQSQALVWNADATAEPVSQGQRFRIAAWVSGAANKRSPLRLGVRTNFGPVTQAHVTDEGQITAVTPVTNTLLRGVYTVPDGVSTIQLAVWRDNLPPAAQVTFAVDDLQLTRVGSRGVPSRPPLGRALARYLVPTYLSPSYDDVAQREQIYRHYISVQPTLTTNSAFAPMYLALGRAAFPFIWLVALISAVIAGHAAGYRSYFFLASLAILYCFAELWRVYIFNFGLIHFLVLILAGAPLIHPLVRRIEPRLLQLKGRARRPRTRRPSGVSD